MWIPRLASLFILLASVSLGYFLYQLDFSSGNNLYTFLWSSSIVLCVLSSISGLGGLIVSFGLDYNNGYFQPKNNWLGEIIKPVIQDNFCVTGMLCGISLAIILSGLVLIGLVLTVIIIYPILLLLLILSVFITHLLSYVFNYCTDKHPLVSFLTFVTIFFGGMFGFVGYYIWKNGINWSAVLEIIKYVWIVLALSFGFQLFYYLLEQWSFYRKICPLQNPLLTTEEKHDNKGE